VPPARAGGAALMPAAPSRTVRCKVDPMNLNTLLWTVAIVLGLMWLLGMITSYTIGGFIHILLVVALIVVLIRLIQGRKLVT
jgi:hypothetical protein